MSWRTDLNPQDTGFWDFSCRLYAKRPVAETCLTLQDRYGMDVNLILFALWLASHQRQLTGPLLRKAAKFSRRWQQQRVVPLRRLRRRMKNNQDRVAPQRLRDYTQLREAVLKTELQAEKVQQQALARLAATEAVIVCGLEGAAAMRANLDALRDGQRLRSEARLESLLAGLASAAGTP